MPRGVVIGKHESRFRRIVAEALARELLADPKERAEHLMLVDLGRNDLGRVCVCGSVRATESFALERYSRVMHIVSEACA